MASPDDVIRKRPKLSLDDVNRVIRERMEAFKACRGSLARDLEKESRPAYLEWARSPDEDTKRNDPFEKGVLMYRMAVIWAITEARWTLCGGPPSSPAAEASCAVDVAPYCVRLASLVPAEMESAAGELWLYEGGRLHEFFDRWMFEGHVGLPWEVRKYGIGTDNEAYRKARGKLEPFFRSGEIPAPPEPPRPTGYGGFGSWAKEMVGLVVAFLRQVETARSRLSKEGGPPKRTGRPVETNPQEDKRIVDAWGTRNFRKYDELAAEWNREHKTTLTRSDIERALQRHRGRKRRSAQKTD